MKIFGKKAKRNHIEEFMEDFNSLPEWRRQEFIGRVKQIIDGRIV